MGVDSDDGSDLGGGDLVVVGDLGGGDGDLLVMVVRT